MNTPAQPPAPEFAGHTPGPWIAYEMGDEDGSWSKWSIVHGGPIAYGGDNCNGPANSRANARLIAAAPTLLAEVASLKAENTRLRAALEKWESRFEMGPDWVSASLETMAWERKEADAMRRALEAIRDGMADDKAYRQAARAALAFSARSQEVQS
jgi:hypothetical protein